MGLVRTGYINLTDKEKLCALRCIALVERRYFHPSSEHLGIAKRALKSLEADGFVTEDAPGVDLWLLTPNGRLIVDSAGGFTYG